MRKVPGPQEVLDECSWGARVEGTLGRGNSRAQQCDRWGQGGVRLEGGQGWGCAGGWGGERGGRRVHGQWHVQISAAEPPALGTGPGPHAPLPVLTAPGEAPVCPFYREGD